MSKLALGTVQFGLDYGINNPSGEIPEHEVFEILDLAVQAGIDTLDTAYGYGTSEAKIGRYLLKPGNRLKFKVISKLPGQYNNHPIQFFEQSLQRLNLQSIYGYMAHSFDSLINDPSLVNFFLGLKQQGRVEKVGVSVYYPKEVDLLIEQKIEFDFVQAPYNLFDQRFELTFKQLQKLGKQVYTRSAFLQGLVFKDPNRLTSHFVKLKDKLTRLREVATLSNSTIPAICLSFCLGRDDIDKVVVGVDSRKHLSQLIEISQSPLPVSFDDLRDQLREDNENLILPTKWPK